MPAQFLHSGEAASRSIALTKDRRPPAAQPRASAMAAFGRYGAAMMRRGGSGKLTAVFDNGFSNLAQMRLQLFVAHIVNVLRPHGYWHRGKLFQPPSYPAGISP